MINVGSFWQNEQFLTPRHFLEHELASRFHGKTKMVLIIREKWKIEEQLVFSNFRIQSSQIFIHVDPEVPFLLWLLNQDVQREYLISSRCRPLDVSWLLTVAISLTALTSTRFINESYSDIVLDPSSFCLLVLGSNAWAGPVFAWYKVDRHVCWCGRVIGLDQCLHSRQSSE